MSTWKTELTATRTAVNSLSPQDSSDHTRTIAMHRARPTMISPVRSSGSSGKHTQARMNINAGPTTQLRARETAIRRLSAAICRVLS